MRYFCDPCSQSFSRQWNYTRHMKSRHLNGEKFKKGRTALDKSGTESQMNDTESREDNSTTTEEHSTTSDGDFYDPWRIVINFTIDKMERTGHKPLSDPKEILQEPYLSEFVRELSWVVDNRIKFANAMQKRDDVYKSIALLKAQIMENDSIDEESCAEKAWSKRKFVIRKIIKENLDLFDKDYDDDEEVERETVPFRRQRDRANQNNANR